jgi:hypothetical protein
MPTQREKIIKKATEILEKSPQGIRYSELVDRIHNEYPEIKIKAIQWHSFDLHRKFKDIVKPERGLFILKRYLERGELPREETERIREEDFYQPFADYLINDLEECSKAIPLGGNRFGDRWGTPDVFGIYKFSETDPLKPPIEIVSAEIKTDTNQLIMAFGQACSYKLLSHKVYLVIPKDAERDISRVESLCLKFGLGLILFDKNNPENPAFKIRTRAVKNEPDYFYVNKYLKLLGDDLKKLF